MAEIGDVPPTPPNWTSSPTEEKSYARRCRRHYREVRRVPLYTECIADVQNKCVLYFYAIPCVFVYRVCFSPFNVDVPIEIRCLSPFICEGFFFSFDYSQQVLEVTRARINRVNTNDFLLINVYTLRIYAFMSLLKRRLKKKKGWKSIYTPAMWRKSRVSGTILVFHGHSVS